MGKRKKNSAIKRKEVVKSTCQAALRNCPTSPRKMRLVTQMISGMDVKRALDVLKFSSQEASRRMEKLLLSAIANWQSKNEGARIEESNLFVKLVHVDGGRSLKRLRTAPQGRGYRIRKRSNHVTLVLDSKVSEKNETTSK
ncbi:MAG: 50S ribosomal protein L22 [Bacteroidales bacterium]|jgi:large subunit ribosomal protein L22|nr:50S ribosomal protein L22 [Bacteroidales bacterium]